MEVIREALLVLRQMIGDSCKQGVMESMSADKMAENEAKVVLALKVGGLV